MITDYILRLPFNTLLNTDQVPDEENDYKSTNIEDYIVLPTVVQNIVKGLGSEFPHFPMVGTRRYNDTCLIHTRLNQLLTKVALEGLFTIYSLPWAVFSIRSAYKDDETNDYLVEYQAPKIDFLPFIDDIWVDETTSRPVTIADAIYLSTYAGTDPIELPPE